MHGSEVGSARPFKAGARAYRQAVAFAHELVTLTGTVAGLTIARSTTLALEQTETTLLASADLIPMERMPIAVRSDWVHNSNDGFFYTNPQQKWSGISPMVGNASVTRPRHSDLWAKHQPGLPPRE